MSNNITKNNAAKHTANLLQNTYNIILGSGSTVNLVIDYIATSHNSLEKLNIVSASSFTSEKLLEYKINEISLIEMKDKSLGASLICVDGADQVVIDTKNNPISILKGHGSALVREKIHWNQCDEIFVVIDENKIVDKITGYIPVEIVPLAQNIVMDKIMAVYNGIEISLHLNSSEEPLITDNHNYILEIHHDGHIEDVNYFHNQVKQIVGVVDTGIFESNLIEKCKFIIGYENEVKVIEQSNKTHS